jgi:hypothetical protein
MKKIILLIAAFLFATFTFAQTKTEMKPADISKAAAGYIAKNFAGYTSDKVFRVDNRGTITWDVMISKGSEKLTLLFDKDGKFLKKEGGKTEPKPASVKPPAPSANGAPKKK